VTLWLAWRRIPETCQPTGLLEIRKLATDARELLRSRRFAGYMLGGAIFSISPYAFVSTAPFILMHELGESLEVAGFLGGVVLLGAFFGNALTSRLVRRSSGEWLLYAGPALAAAAAITLLVLSLCQLLQTWSLVACMLVFTCGVGMSNPVAMARALGVDTRLTGTASGLYGCTQMAAGAGITGFAALGSRPSVTAACVLLAATLSGVLCFAAAWGRRS
jgi:DHA1 family bicyclomycin/chloramphenicol resistance-like MFS transporter